VSKVVPAPHVWIVAVPETAGVHWKTRSGEPPELPQLPASELEPLVAPLKVPPCAGMTVGLLQPPARVTRVVVVVVEVVVVAMQASVVTFTLPLFVDSFPARSTAETA
jgi:hypothetical protein